MCFMNLLIRVVHMTLRVIGLFLSVFVGDLPSIFCCIVVILPQRQAAYEFSLPSFAVFTCIYLGELVAFYLCC